MLPTHVSTIPNGLRDERLAAGIATPDEFAERAGLDTEFYRALEDGRVLPHREEFERIRSALGGIDADRLYKVNHRQLIGLYADGYANELVELFRRKRGPEQLLVAKDDVTWSERGFARDTDIDVYLNMSCGTQESPHLLLDTVALCRALGIRFTAGAGPAGCCGKPIIADGKIEAGERWIQAKARKIAQAGGTAQVNWCVACQSTTTTSAARLKFLEGHDHPVRQVQLFEFLGDRLEELGDRVPWGAELNRRVVVEGHDWSGDHYRAWQMTARFLRMIPGVEVVSMYDGFADESPCGGRARERVQGPWTQLETADEVQARRAELGTVVQSLGADTIACMHQGCHQVWSRYAGPALTVQHGVSILAEAVGCAHPDRYQAAVRVGDADEIVAQTRGNWESWGLNETAARELADSFLVDPRFAAGVTHCSCGEGAGCAEPLISLDVLSATAKPRGAATS